jgi:hypothetical protein
MSFDRCSLFSIQAKLHCSACAVHFFNGRVILFRGAVFEVTLLFLPSSCTASTPASLFRQHAIPQSPTCVLPLFLRTIVLRHPTLFSESSQCLIAHAASSGADVGCQSRRSHGPVHIRPVFAMTPRASRARDFDLRCDPLAGDGAHAGR